MWSLTQPFSSNRRHSCSATDKRIRVYQPTVGEELKAVAQDHCIKTRPQENAQRRTILLTRRNDSWGFTLQSYGIHHKTRDEVELVTYVDYVELGGPACVAGMRQGDVILSINGASMEAASHQTLVTCIKTGGDTMRMVVLFENCFKKVELHLRFLKLKKLQAGKDFELKSVEEAMERITLGKCLMDSQRHSLTSTSSSSSSSCCNSNSSSSSLGSVWEEQLCLRPDLDACPSPLLPPRAFRSSSEGSLFSQGTACGVSVHRSSPTSSSTGSGTSACEPDSPDISTGMHGNIKGDDKAKKYPTSPSLRRSSHPALKCSRRPELVHSTKSASEDVSSSIRPHCFNYLEHCKDSHLLHSSRSVPKLRTDQCWPSDRRTPTLNRSRSSDSGEGLPPLRKNLRSRQTPRSWSLRPSFYHSVQLSSGDPGSCNYMVTEDKHGVMQSEPKLVRLKYGDVDLTNTCPETNPTPLRYHSCSAVSQSQQNNQHGTPDGENIQGGLGNNGKQNGSSPIGGITSGNPHPRVSGNDDASMRYLKQEQHNEPANVICVRYTKHEQSIELANRTPTRAKETMSLDQTTTHSSQLPYHEGVKLQSLHISPRNSCCSLSPTTADSSCSFFISSDCASAGDPFDDSSPETNSPSFRNCISPLSAIGARDSWNRATNDTPIMSRLNDYVKPNQSQVYSRRLNTSCLPTTLMYINEEDDTTRL